jgi:CRISPR-associated endonuclease/helicase Cas3
VAEEAATHESVLMVHNTTSEAARTAAVWRGLRAGREEEVFHLSARMSPAHRGVFIDEVRRRLHESLPTMLASTQLIEAGVDLDFPIGYRACCGIDSVVQTGGRVNRSARLDGSGRLVVFNADDIRPLRDLEVATDQASKLFWDKGADPLDATVQRLYWSRLYRKLGVEEAESVGVHVQRARAGLDYTAVVKGPVLDHGSGVRDGRKAFRMIDGDPVAVVIPASALRGQVVTPSCQDGAGLGAEPDLIARVRQPGETAAALRALQPFIASLHPGLARRPDMLALMEPLLGKPGDPGSVVVWNGGYDRLTGMVIDFEAEDFLI